METPLAEQIRVQSGLSQAELARRAGLPRSVVNAYVQGAREPGVGAIVRLAAAAGLELRLDRRKSPVDPDRAGRLLIQVLELAEALPFRPKADLDYPRLSDRLASRSAV